MNEHQKNIVLTVIFVCFILVTTGVWVSNFYLGWKFVCTAIALALATSCALESVSTNSKR